MIKSLYLSSFFCVLFVMTSARCPSALQGFFFYNVDTLLVLERKALNGDKNSLLELSRCMLDTTTVDGRLDNHRLSKTKGRLARWMIVNATSFLPGEFNWNDSTDSIINNLERLSERINFDSSRCMYLFTPLNKRSVAYKILKIPPSKASELAARRKDIITSNEIKLLNPTAERIKDPVILLEIANAMYRERNNYSVIEHYTDAIELLTGCNIGVMTNSGSLMFHDEIYRDNADAASYLIYWENNYSSYYYDSTVERFINKKDILIDVSATYDLYKQLNDSNSTIRENSFVQLTQAAPGDISILNDAYGSLTGNTSFAKSYLLQLAYLTEYCHKHEISYNETGVRKYFYALYGDRYDTYRQYSYDDSFVNKMGIDDVTTFEYWSIISSLSNLPYPGIVSIRIGYIIDKFYSLRWKQIVNDKRQLALYLKKSCLFSRLGIIGSCNSYLYKFYNTDSAAVFKLRELAAETTDTMIKAQVNIILNPAISSQKNNKTNDDNAYWDKAVRESKFAFTSINDTLNAIMKNKTIDAAKKNNIQDICCMASYRQLDTAINALMAIEDYEHIYVLVKEVFGITVSPILNKADANAFISNYRTMDEGHLYAYYLREAGFDIWTNNNIDYNKAYTALKFGRPQAFLGTGTGDLGGSAITKLLEIHFGETFDLPDRVIKYSYGFSFITEFSSLRRRMWMQYLVAKQLVTVLQNDPPSFSDESFF